MPTIQPHGLLSVPLDRARQTLAMSAAFQNWVGVSTLQDALPFIHIFQTDQQTRPPFCILDLGHEFERQRTSLTNGRPFEPRGQVIAYFRDAVHSGDATPDHVYRFTNTLGAIWADLETLAGQSDTIGIENIKLLSPPTRIETDRRQYAGDYYECALGLSWRVDPRS